MSSLRRQSFEHDNELFNHIDVHDSYCAPTQDCPADPTAARVPTSASYAAPSALNTGAGAPTSAAVPVAMSPAMAEAADTYKVGAYVNRGVMNPRGFYETEVTLSLKNGSMKQFAEGVNTSGETGVMPVLQLHPTSRVFELQGTKGEKRTAMHAQGNIYLSEIRSTLPCSIMLQPSSQLRGARSQSCYSDTGIRGVHLALPFEHKSFHENPRLLLESKMGDMTASYVNTFPDYLTSASLTKAIEPVEGNSKVWLIKLSSPIVDMVNTARVEKGMRQLVPDESAKQIGKLVVSKEEASAAIAELEQCLDGSVNHVPLYDALKFRVSRVDSKTPDDSASTHGDLWLVKDGIELKDKSKEVSEQAFDKSHMVHVRLIVEHKPHLNEASVVEAAKPDA